ncbi:GTP cyclohydrolase II [Pseudonocardia sp. NPDC049635]|uniref:GTP cyclohydrolase II n=1 Tax=Pseudonocardia sp. NPDC049635 TaxID=3155506 RepID=UPI0033D27A0A
MTEPTPIPDPADTAVARAVAALASGGMVVVLDDDDRENEADLFLAAEHATTEKVAFFLAHTSGFLCVALSTERATALDLRPQVTHNTDPHGTAYLTTVDTIHDTTTGISAADRAKTCRALAAASTRPADLSRPGHVIPLGARPGGVLERQGHTEAAVDLARAAGCAEATLLCELVTPDRTGMLRGQGALNFAEEHELPVLTVADLLRHRRRIDSVVEREGSAMIPTRHGPFETVAFRSRADGTEHVALVLRDADGEIGAADDPPLVRVHSECLTGDVFGSERCDCGEQLDTALHMIRAAGRGVLVYLRGHEGRGIGIGHKMRAYQLQQQLGLDTVDANLRLGLPVDNRHYGVGAAILADLGVTAVRLITNNPEKYAGIAEYSIRIVERVTTTTSTNRHNIAYLTTKRDRLGHLLDLPVSEGGLNHPGVSGDSIL